MDVLFPDRGSWALSRGSRRIRPSSMSPFEALNRRSFLRRSFLAGAGLSACHYLGWPDAGDLLPVGSAPAALGSPHFGSRMQAFVWRNWQLVPLARMAATVRARESDLRELGALLGLGAPPAISREIEQRAFITVIRRNWHLLPYDQLLTLLGWTSEQLAFTLREDDFLFVKLGSLKPRCEPLNWSAPTPAERARAAEIASIVREEFGNVPLSGQEPLFSFVARLSTSADATVSPGAADPSKAAMPRFCYSYFALYGDALLDPNLDPYPDGYLARLAESGVSGVWLQGLLAHLAPFPWDQRVSVGFERRQEQLLRLVERAARHGLKVYLYLNEPRARSLAFFEEHPGAQGGDARRSRRVVHVGAGGAALAERSHRDHLPGGAWARRILHHHGIREFHELLVAPPGDALRSVWRTWGGGSHRRVAGDISSGDPTSGRRSTVDRLGLGLGGCVGRTARGASAGEVAVMSVSEWEVEIERGGIRSQVGEYSLSALGPGAAGTAALGGRPAARAARARESPGGEHLGIGGGTVSSRPSNRPGHRAETCGKKKSAV